MTERCHTRDVVGPGLRWSKRAATPQRDRFESLDPNIGLKLPSPFVLSKLCIFAAAPVIVPSLDVMLLSRDQARDPFEPCDISCESKLPSELLDMALFALPDDDLLPLPDLPLFKVRQFF